MIKLALEKSLDIQSEQVKRQVAKFTQISWTGFRQGDVFCGNLPDCFGFFQLQQAGNELMASMSMEQACHALKPDYDIEKDSQEELKQLMEAQQGQHVVGEG